MTSNLLSLSFQPKAPAPFAFHCTICFETFNNKDRPPVVLPCGHTFLCGPCSKRLKRCMECRTSLFFKPTEQSSSSSNRSPRRTYPGRNSAYRGGNLNVNISVSSPPTSAPNSISKSCPSTPSTTSPAKIPLPLPKNLLLLSLMENKVRQEKLHEQISLPAPPFTSEPTSSSERKIEKPISIQSSHSFSSTGALVNLDHEQGGTEKEVKLVRSFESQSGEDGTTEVTGNFIPEKTSSNDTLLIDSLSLKGEEIENCEENENENLKTIIQSAMTSMYSTHCGTYAVTDKGGLLVLPRKPKGIVGRSHNYTSSLIRKSKHANKFPPNHQPPPPANNTSSPKIPETRRRIRNFPEDPLPYQLEYNSRVQVVTIEDGWVQLARNAGYLYVDSDQLVKVGPPLDRACELEAMIRCLDTIHSELQTKSDETIRMQSSLIHQLYRSSVKGNTSDNTNETDFMPNNLQQQDYGKENNILTASPSSPPHTTNDLYHQKLSELLRTPSPPTYIAVAPTSAQSLHSPRLSPPSPMTSPWGNKSPQRHINSTFFSSLSTPTTPPQLQFNRHVRSLTPPARLSGLSM